MNPSKIQCADFLNTNLDSPVKSTPPTLFPLPGHAVACVVSEMVLCAFGAFRAGRVVAAVETAPVPKFRVENALVGTPVALALYALTLYALMY